MKVGISFRKVISADAKLAFLISTKNVPIQNFVCRYVKRRIRNYNNRLLDL